MERFPRSCSLSASLVSGPSDGVLVLNADGSFEYTSVKGFKGTDEFTYRASDGTDVSHIATVVITVRISVLPTRSTLPRYGCRCRWQR